MKYRKGFKYQLAELDTYQTDFRPETDLITTFVIMRTTGLLELLHGFAWDGMSGPVVDRKTNQKAGALHDGLYRLMRKGFLDYRQWKLADAECEKQLRKDGAWESTIWVDMKGLAIAKGAAANPDNIAKIYEV